MIVGDKEGVWRARTVGRKVIEQRWHPKTMELVGGVLWRTDGSEGDGDDLKTEVTMEETKGKRGSVVRTRTTL